MTEYMHLFFEDTRQISSLLAVALVWAGLAALGRILVRSQEDRILAPLLGWAIVTITFTVIGTLSSIAFTWIALALAIVAIAVALFTLHQDKWLIDPSFLRSLLWAAPLLLLTSAMIGSQWDEFSHWLTGTKYLLHTDTFPGIGRSESSASYPAYPYAWQLLAYLAGRLQGGIVENAGALLNLLLLLTLGRVAVVKAAAVSGMTRSLTSAPWMAAALAVASISVFNPTFVEKVILTAYADAATSVTLAVGIVIGWSMLEALAQQNKKHAYQRAMMAGMVFVVLVSLKQSTLELFGLAVGALFFCGLVSREVRFVPLLKSILIAALPAVLIYGMWRHYVSVELQGQEFTIRPFAAWAFDLLPVIVYKMAGVLLKKSAYAAAMLVAVIVGFRGMICGQTPYSRSMLAIGVVFLGHTAFLLFCYIAVFSGGEAENIASYWRYNQQLGGLAVLAIVMSAAVLIHRFAEKLPLGKLKWVAVALIVAGPFIFAHKLRFDTSPVYAQYRMVGREVAARIEPGARVGVLDPLGSGESGVMLRYEVSDLTQNVWYQASFHDMSAAALAALWQQLGDEYLVVNSVTPAVQTAISSALQPDHSYLLKRRPDGSPEVLASWPWPTRP